MIHPGLHQPCFMRIVHGPTASNRAMGVGLFRWADRDDLGLTRPRLRPGAGGQVQRVEARAVLSHPRNPSLCGRKRGAWRRGDKKNHRHAASVACCNCACLRSASGSMEEWKRRGGGRGDPSGFIWPPSNGTTQRSMPKNMLMVYLSYKEDFPGLDLSFNVANNHAQPGQHKAMT